MTVPPSPATPASPPLDYAPRPATRWRWARRVLRWWPAWVLLIVAWLGVAYGPRAWRHYKLMRLQEACMAAEMPADRPVKADGGAAALDRSWPGEYHLWGVGGSPPIAERTDPRWAALRGQIGVPPWPGSSETIQPATVFLHERRAAGGARRLVVFEGWGRATIIEPAGWFGGGPRVVWREQVARDPVSEQALKAASELPSRSRTDGGVADLADRSRWTVPFVYNGISGTWEYRLGDDDRVTERLLDSDGFRVRAEAATHAAEGRGR